MAVDLASVLREIDCVMDRRERLLEIFRKVEIHLTSEEGHLLLSAVERQRTYFTHRYYDLLDDKSTLLQEVKNSESLQTG